MDWAKRVKEEVEKILSENPPWEIAPDHLDLLELIWLSGYKAGLVETVQDILGKEADLPK